MKTQVFCHVTLSSTVWCPTSRRIVFSYIQGQAVQEDLPDYATVDMKALLAHSFRRRNYLSVGTM
jgi:hypothetical protein